MKQLGITEKEEIERMGVATFNAKARESVLAYTREWEDYVTRQARWVDFERGYKTLDTAYMEIGPVGVQDPVRQGPRLRGLPRAALLLARPDAAVHA